MLLVPCRQKLLLLTRHAQVVPVKHIERNPGYETFDLITWFSNALGEINFCPALAVLGRYSWSHTVVEIASVTVHLSHSGIEVEQVGFHRPKNGIVIHAMLSTAVLPALALMTKRPRRNDVLPFSAVGAILWRPGLVAIGLRFYSAARLTDPCPFAAAVEIAMCTIGQIACKADPPAAVRAY
jgi:hypothetical protein